MGLPSRAEAKILLEKHVKDDYQKFHALMVGTAMEGYAEKYGTDKDLWFLTGYLHDLDYDEYPETHPAESLGWFKEKRLKSKAFAAKIDRETIYMGCEHLGVTIEEHVGNLIQFFGAEPAINI